MTYNHCMLQYDKATSNVFHNKGIISMNSDHKNPHTRVLTFEKDHGCPIGCVIDFFLYFYLISSIDIIGPDMFEIRKYRLKKSGTKTEPVPSKSKTDARR